MSFEFTITEAFVESLHKLDKNIQLHIKKKLKTLLEYEKPLYFAKKLKGKKNIFRFRAGVYRIVFRLEGKEIILLLVKHRKDIYVGL